MRLSKFLLIALMPLLGLAGCSLPEPGTHPSQNLSGADFLVDSIRGDVINTKYEEAFSFPISRQYNLAACVKSLSHSRPLVGQEFIVEETKQKLKADSQGCLNWTENLSMDYLNASVYIPLERTLKAQGLSRGSRKIRFGVNPWSHGEPGPLKAVDLAKADVPVLKEQSVPMDRNLWMEDIRLSVTDDRLVKGGLSLTYQLYGAPRVVLSNMANERVLEVLKRGRFDVEVSLIQQDLINGQEVRVEINKHSLRAVEIKNETLSLRVPMLLANLPKSGQVFLGIKLKPLGEKTGRLKSFEAIYSMGDFRAIRSPNFLKVSPTMGNDPGFKLTNFLTPKHEIQSGIKSAPIQQKATIQWEPLRFDFSQRGVESAMKRQIAYRITACLRSGIDTDTVLSRKFDITKSSFGAKDKPKTIPLETDPLTSCLYWDEVLEFNVHECQRFMSAEVRISNSDLGFDQKIRYLINPWDNGTAFELRPGQRYDHLTTACDPQKPTQSFLDLKNYAFSMKDMNYEVDQNLNLLFKKKVNFRMDPQIMNYSSLTNGIDNRRPLPDGPYLLRLVVTKMRDSDSDNTYVTHVEKLVKVLGGTINEDLDFITRDLKSFGNRNTLLVELLPVDRNKVTTTPDGGYRLARRVPSHRHAIQKNSDIARETFEGFVILSGVDGGSNLRRSNATALTQYLINRKSPAERGEQDLLSEIIRQGWSRQREELAEIAKQSSPEIFAKSEGLRYLDLKKLPGRKEGKALAVRFKDVEDFVGFERFNSKAHWERAKESASPLDLEPFKKLVVGEWSPRAVESMCLYFAHEIMASSFEEGFLPNFKYECMSRARANPAEFFTVEKYKYAHRLARAERVSYGQRHSLHFGTAFQLSKGFSRSKSVQTSLGADLGGRFPFGDFFGLGLTGSASVSWATSQSSDRGNSITVDEGRALMVAENLLRLTVRTAEDCAVVRLNPKLFQKQPRNWIGLRGTNYAKHLRDDLTDPQKFEAIQRGVFACTGEPAQKPFTVTESYYLINQEVFDSDAMNSFDEMNRPFYFSLRGKSDYQRFVKLIQANPTAPNSADAGDLTFEQLGSDLNNALMSTKTAPRLIKIP